MALKHLQDVVLRKIDAADASFWSARTASSSEGARLGLLERQRLRVWLGHVEGELARLGV
jgi:phage gp46-like protein